MNNADTVIAIAENMRAAAQREGILFSYMTGSQARNVPASVMPVGEIVYTGETFEDSYGQRPCYVTAGFVIKVTLAGRNQEDIMRGQQVWAHKLRGALTINSLNTGALSLSKPVSRVQITGVQAEDGEDSGRTLTCAVAVRYREAV